ncbi:MAG: GDSL-type esterase/lipase family protein [Thermoanaerobaculia bacterium]
MRRFFFWTFPTVISVAAAALFGWGFYLALRGDVGTAVGQTPLGPAPAAAENAPTPSRPLRLLIMGDSLARGTGDTSGEGLSGSIDAELKRRGIPHQEPVNVAVNGATTKDLLQSLSHPGLQRLIASSQVVVVSIGGNDFFVEQRGARVAPQNPDALIGGVAERVERIVHQIAAANPKARIFIVGLYNPFRKTPADKLIATAVAEWNSRLIRQFAGNENVTVVQTSDLFTYRDRLSFDRFHPNAEAYRAIGRRIAEAI